MFYISFQLSILAPSSPIVNYINSVYKRTDSNWTNSIAAAVIQLLKTNEPNESSASMTCRIRESIPEIIL